MTAFRLYGFQVMVEEHKLGRGEARLALNSEFVEVVADFGVPNFLHDEVEN